MGALAFGYGISLGIQWMIRMILKGIKIHSQDEARRIDAVFHRHPSLGYGDEMLLILLSLILDASDGERTNREKIRDYLNGIENTAYNDLISKSENLERITDPDDLARDVRSFFNEILLKKPDLKLGLSPPTLEILLATAQEPRDGEPNDSKIYPVLMAFQTAFRFGLLKKNPPDFNENFPLTSPKIHMIFMMCSYNSEDGEDYESILEIAETNYPSHTNFGNIEPRNEIFQVWKEQTNGKLGFSIEFKLDFDSLEDFYKGYSERIGTIGSFKISHTQIGTTYDKNNRTENTGIFIGLSVVDAIYRKARDIQLGNHTHPTGLQLIEHSGKGKLADYFSSLGDEKGIIIENKGLRDKGYNDGLKKMTEGFIQAKISMNDSDNTNMTKSKAQGFVTVTARRKVKNPQTGDAEMQHYFILEGIYKH